MTAVVHLLLGVPYRRSFLDGILMILLYYKLRVLLDASVDQ